MTCDPDEVTSGGTDFRIDAEVNQVKMKISGYLDQGFRVIVHMAPPCSTFSRARDRSSATRLRSTESPAGDETDQKTEEANLIASNAYRLLLWAVGQGCFGYA